VALVDEAVEKIRELIRAGLLPAGGRLPAERQLATQLSVSRNTTREAVKVLASAGVLDVRQGDGTFVTNLSPQLLLEGLGFAIDLLHERHVMQVIEVRRMLEPQAAAAAASRASGDDLNAIGDHLARMREAATRHETMIEEDIAFHSRIARASGNELLASMLDGLSGHTLRARIWRGIVDHGSTSQTLAEHQAIYDALVRRDPAIVHAAALLHVDTSEQWMRRMIAEGTAHFEG
jgi:GntR family transcriptional repressor for pyruvate dehydrogenase complex